METEWRLKFGPFIFRSKTSATFAFISMGVVFLCCCCGPIITALFN